MLSDSDLSIAFESECSGEYSNGHISLLLISYLFIHNNNFNFLLKETLKLFQTLPNDFLFLFGYFFGLSYGFEI